MTTPRVSVLMTVYNGEDYLEAAVDSILEQTCDSLEFVVVDDGSTDSTWDILSTYADPRMVFLRNRTNRGIPYSSNRGLDLCRGEYVARMDADDVAAPTRLERQADLLDARSEVGVVGCEKYLVDGNGDRIDYYGNPETDVEIRWESLLNCPWGHPTLMFRRETVDRNGLRYDESFSVGADVDFMAQLLEHTAGYTIPEPLHRYRWHGENVSIQQRRTQFENLVSVAAHRIETELPGFDMDRGQVRRLVATFHRDADLVEYDLDAYKYDCLDSYLSLLRAFVDRYEGRQNLRRVKQRALFRALPRILARPHRPADAVLLARALAIEPRLPLDQVRRSIGVRLSDSEERRELIG